MPCWNRVSAATPLRLIALAALTLGVPGRLEAQVRDTSRAAGVAPDNTRRNKEGGITAQQQGRDSTDRRITKDIRQAVVKNKTLSGYAHNVKIITIKDVVTLRGPVRTEQEKLTIETMARAEPGVAQVVNELTIKPRKPKDAGKALKSEKPEKPAKPKSPATP
jgi:hyperosmotically inducible protein